MLVLLSHMLAVLSYPGESSASAQHLQQLRLEPLSHHEPEPQVASVFMWAGDCHQCGTSPSSVFNNNFKKVLKLDRTNPSSARSSRPQDLQLLVP